VHLVRGVMDEVFGSENFISLISYQKSTPLSTSLLPSTCDYIIWYAKKKENVKYRQIFINKVAGEEGASRYKNVETKDGKIIPVSEFEGDFSKVRLFTDSDLSAQTLSISNTFEFEFNGKSYKPSAGRHWQTHKNGLRRLADKNRIMIQGNRLRYIRYFDDFPVNPLNNIWTDIGGIQSRSDPKVYAVQTSTTTIQRCLLMTTDPGDLVLDPTCDGGSTAYVAEQWGRRWITIDTSRIALNIAKQRVMTAVFPYFKLYDEINEDVRLGFKYKTVPHITLKSIANDEPPDTETLYDQPEQDKKLLRVSGPFTVETLQNYEPISPEELDDEVRVNEEEGAFEEVIKQHLLSAGIKNGRKNEMVVFRSVELLAGEALHAEGFYQTVKGEEKAYFHIGPKFGSVNKKLVNDAVKECRQRGDANWLVILGFSFESDIEGSTQTMSMGTFEVTKVRIHDDLLQEGLKKKPAKSAASFVTIGEPDIAINKDGNKVTVEIQGLDIYDPIKDEVKPRDVHDIAYWMVDDDYDGSNFIVKQVYFCGGDKDEFDKWKKGLDNLAKENTKKKVEKTLKIEINDEAFDRLYGHISHPIEIKTKGQKIAVRIISQFGEECTKVLKV